ncbi:hypothetical protein JL721_12691 [Aureococcus anophagefferens]|nr:hypothetical protein JL721_12691 [Aureococcus anophagefferens]
MTGLSASDVNEDADVRAAFKATIISLGGYDEVSNIVAKSTSSRRRLQDEDGAEPDGRPTGAPTRSHDQPDVAHDQPDVASRLADRCSTTSPDGRPHGRADLGSHDQPDWDGRPTRADLAPTTSPTVAPRPAATPAPSVSPTPAPWIQRGDDIDGEAADDWSGYSVSLSADGTTLAVGAPYNDGGGSYAGHARVFAWDPVDETWKQRGDDIDGEAADDWSGYSVSLSADGATLAVGAVYNDGAGSSAGHVRAFAWDPVEETWVQRGDDIDGEAADDRSGYSVSLSADGTALAVGAPYNDGGGTDAGHVRVFAWDPVEETWVQRGDDIDGEAADDRSGYSVSLSADGTALATWKQRGDDIDGEAAGDLSGISVSLSADGTALAVGAIYNDGGGSYAGHARVFAWDSVDETWVQRGDDIDGEAADDRSGISVSLSADGTALAVGAHYNDGGGTDAGHARVFAWNSVEETWVQRGDDIDGEAAADWSGISVSLSADGADGTTPAVGAYGNDGAGFNAGHARVYSISPAPSVSPTPAPWIQRGDDIDGEAADDWSGYSVSLERRHDATPGRPTTTGGVSLATLRVRGDPVDETWKQRGDDIDGEAADDWSATGTWKQRGDDIDGEAAGDLSGISVSLSADGTALAAGRSTTTGGRFTLATPRSRTPSTRRVQRGDDIDGEAADDRSGISVSLS